MEIVLASNNAGKLVEFNQLLSGLDVHFTPQSKFNVSDADETGLTFVENAIIKARHASQKTNMPALADDSGLEVDALGGEPGIYSARYGGEHGNNKKNIECVLEKLSGVPEEQRTARFHCALAWMRHPNDPDPLIFQGIWEGRILANQHGEKGFGYDPIFFVPEQNCTAAELDPAIKNSISHRAQAMEKFLVELKGV